MKLGDNRQAKEVLARIPDDGSEASAEKWYQSAEIARNTNDDAELTTILQHMRATTPTSPWLESALFTAGNMYLLRQDYDRAIDYYKEIHDRFPNSSKASYAHWKCAWLTYRQNRPEQAKKYFDQQIEFYPASNEVANAIYWRGRMAEDGPQLRTGPRLLPEADRPLPQLLLRRGGAEALGNHARCASQSRLPACRAFLA